MLELALIVLGSLAPLALAHDQMDGMDMGSSSGSSSHGMSMTFHANIGSDMLWFEAWMPTSKGAFAGACIGLFLLAVFSRFLAAVGAAADLRRNLKLQRVLADLQREELSTKERDAGVEHDAQGHLAALASYGHIRSAPPFNLEYDLARGGMAIVTYGIGMLLMLAIMTGQAFWFISILLGMGAGEVAFGRFAVGGHIM